MQGILSCCHLQQRRPEPAARDHRQKTLANVQGWRPPQPPRSAAAAARSPSQCKEWFGIWRWNLLRFSWCPLPLVLALDTSEKSLPPSSSRLPFRHVCTSKRPLPPLEPPQHQEEQSQLSQALPTRDLLPVPASPAWPFAALSPVAPHLSCAGEPSAPHSTTDLAWPALRGGQRSPPSRAGHTPPHAAQHTAGCLGPKPPCQLMLTLVSPRAFPDTLLSSIDGHFPSLGLNAGSRPASSVRVPRAAALLLQSSGTRQSWCHSWAEKARQGSTASPSPALCPFPTSCKPHQKALSPLPAASSLPLPKPPTLSQPGKLRNSICPPTAAWPPHRRSSQLATRKEGDVTCMQETFIVPRGAGESDRETVGKTRPREAGCHM